MIVGLSAILPGCKAPAVARSDRGSPLASVASQAPATNEGDLKDKIAAQRPDEQTDPPVSSVPAPAGRQRRSIRNLLGLGGDKQPVPLPTTQVSEERPLANGPVEEFQ